MLKAMADGVQTTPILNDDTNVFVLLVYWISRMRVIANIQMEVEWRCPGCQQNHSAVRLQKVQLASRCPHTVGWRYVVMPLRKRKALALNILEIDIPGHDEVLGQLSTTHDQLKATADTFLLLTPLWREELYDNE